MSFTVAIALVVGLLAQIAGRALQLPALVLLLIAGVVLGPDGLGLVQPDLLGDGLRALVAFAVAVILFEGGLGLKVRALRRHERPIRRLVTVGGLLTVLGSFAVARYVFGMPLYPALLFGTVIMVTGPTVIGPLLRRLELERGVATILSAEGVLIDAVGAVSAIVVLEVLLHPVAPETVAWGGLHLLGRLGGGLLIGLAGGLLLAFTLDKARHYLHQLSDAFALACVLTLFFVSNAVLEESGVVAVTAAGVVVGNHHSPLGKQLHRFKEQLTTIFIGMLFVLLAADVRLATVVDLGGRGVLTVVLLILVVRPLAVILSTAGSGLSMRRRLMVAAIGPRGIVAAAVASYVAAYLGGDWGHTFRALVFLTIAASAVSAAVLGKLAAKLLGLEGDRTEGWVIVGAHPVGRALAAALIGDGESVVLVDEDPELSRVAEEAGLPMVYGSPIAESTLKRARLSSRKVLLAMTDRPELNLVVVERARALVGPGQCWALVDREKSPAEARMLEDMGAQALPWTLADVRRWCRRLNGGRAAVETRDRTDRLPEQGAFPLTRRDGNRTRPLFEIGLGRAVRAFLVSTLSDGEDDGAHRLPPRYRPARPGPAGG